MTGEPGDECPKCGRRLTSAPCTCGWVPSSASGRCAVCGAERVDLDEDQVLRCAACHVEWLRVRAALDPIDADELERCRAAIRASLARVATRVASRSIAVSDPPGSELSGSHPENFRS